MGGIASKKYLHRRRARVDRNQAEIVLALRTAGYSVFSTAPLGKGFPDLVVGRNNRNVLLEIKASTRDKLTHHEAVFFAMWQGQRARVNNVDEALSVCREACDG